MAIRVDNELALAPCGVEQKTGFLARGNRVAGQRQVHGNMEEIIILEWVGAYAPIVGEAPNIPVGKATRRADAQIAKRNESGVVVHDAERGTGDIVVLTRMHDDRIDRAYLRIGSIGGREGDKCRITCVAVR